MRNAALLLLGTIALLSGCARYEYQLVRPPELTRQVGRNIDQVFALEPLEYRLRTVDNRLVMRVFNQSQDPIELLGQKCSVVDPEGQSHPLPGQTIAPGSFIKMIFPPPRPRTYDPYYGPSWHTGVGVGVRVDGRWRGRQFPPSPQVRPSPVYLDVYDEANAYYWDWRGEGEARIMLVYRKGEEEFRHDFLFRRRRV